MKKAFVLLVSLVLSLPLCASAEGYPAGWYSLSGDGVELSLFYLPEGSSVSVPDSMVLSPVETVRPFSIAPGIYSVSADVPSGAYSIRCDDSSSWCIVTIKDADDKLVLSQVFHLDDGNYVGKIELLEGYSVKVENGTARFEAARGVIID